MPAWVIIPLGVGEFVITLKKGRLMAHIVIECGEQEGHPIQYETMECAGKLFDSLSCGSMEEEAPAVFPPTPDFLHEHYDIVKSGSYTTHRDADFIGQPIRMLLEKNGSKDEEAYKLMKISGDTYHLDQDAVSLAKVFRLDSSLFDPYGDTEALIRKGMFKDAQSLEALRSLGWTVSCMADRSGREVGDYSFAELEKIGELIEEKNYLNYFPFSYMPGLCDHYDWHVFYVPDEYLKSDCQAGNDLRYLTGKENRGGSSTTIFFPGMPGLANMNRMNDLIGRNEETLESLEALRNDLEALLPVMETIHDGLLDGRDRSQKPEGVLADALTAWCALAIAAKEPFYSEEAADTPEADAGLEGPLTRPTDKLDDKPVKSGGTTAKKTKKPAAKPTAKPAAPAGDILDLGGATAIQQGQFAGNMALRNIVIPEGVTEIGEKAFYSCMSLESVVLPKSLKKIGDYAFMSCRALHKVVIPEGVEEIGNHAFGATNNLKELRLPDSLKKVYWAMFGFGGDSPYATAYLSGDLVCRLAEEQKKSNSRGDVLLARHYVIDGAPYESISEYLDDVQSGKVKPQTAPKQAAEEEKSTAKKPAAVGRTAAKKAPAKKTAAKAPAEKKPGIPPVTIDAKGGTSIDKAHVDPYKKANEIIVPEGITRINMHAFYFSKAEKIVLPKSLKQIADNAFCGCRNLKDIELPEGLETIGDTAFLGCSELRHVNIPDSVRELGSQAFAKPGTNLDLTVHMSPEMAHRLLLKRESQPDYELYGVRYEIDGFFFKTLDEYKKFREKDQQADEIITEANRRKETTAQEKTENPVVLKIKPGQTVIEENEFVGLPDYGPVIIPEGIKTIGGNAFLAAKACAFKLPQTLRKIEAGAFSKCANLESVEIPEGLMTIDPFVFTDCPNLHMIRLPSTIKTVSSGAFVESLQADDSSIITVQIPGHVARLLVKANAYPWKPAVIAREFVINGNRYSTLEEYAEKAEAEEKAQEERERAERRAKEARERQQEAATAREREQAEQRKKIMDEITRLEVEKAGIRGLFSGSKKKKIEKRLDELRSLLRK